MTSRWLQRARVPLGFAAAIVYLVMMRPSLWTIVAGLPLIVFGEGIRVAASGCIRKNRELATNGPYAFVRHPLYVGSALIVTGFAIASGRVVVGVALVGLFLLVYTPVAKREEQSLEQQFGDAFRAWRERVPAVIPRLALPARDAGFGMDDFRWSAVHGHREYRAWIGETVVLVLLACRVFYTHGP